MISPWYVITGGPSSGKTTLINKLSSLGFETVPEAARAVIDKYAKKGVQTEEIRKDEAVFQKLVLEMQLKMEAKAPKGKVVFFDRGVPDSIAYYRLYGLDTTPEMARNRYRRIFFLKQLQFHKDYARTEDAAAVKKINCLLMKTYRDLGYKIVLVPAVPVDERAKLVLSQL